jgi:hypothetical protein
LHYSLSTAQNKYRFATNGASLEGYIPDDPELPAGMTLADMMYSFTRTYRSDETVVLGFSVNGSLGLPSRNGFIMSVSYAGVLLTTTGDNSSSIKMTTNEELATGTWFSNATFDDSAWLPANESTRCSAATSPEINVHGIQYTNYVSDNGAFVQEVSAGRTAFWVGASTPLGECDFNSTVYFRVVLRLPSLVKSPACLSASSPLLAVVNNAFPMYLIENVPMGVATLTSKPLTIIFGADDRSNVYLNGMNLGSKSQLRRYSL